MTAWVLAAALIVAPDYLTEVVGEPTSTTGTVSEVTLRAQACASRSLNSGSDGGQVILSSDPAAGVVVAANWLEYRDGMVPWKLRSRVTIEVREGRFRVRHDSIERHNDQSFGAQVLGASPWSPVGKWWGSGWQKAETALKAVSDRLSSCIQSAPTGDDW